MFSTFSFHFRVLVQTGSVLIQQRLSTAWMGSTGAGFLKPEIGQGNIKCTLMNQYCFSIVSITLYESISLETTNTGLIQ